MASICAIFTSTYHTKQLNPWPNSSASHVVNYSWLSVCQEEIQPPEDHSSTCVHLTCPRNKPQQSSLDNFHHQYLAELLVNVYNYHLMVKSVSSCCVRGSWLFSNPVTCTYSVYFRAEFFIRISFYLYLQGRKSYVW